MTQESKKQTEQAQNLPEEEKLKQENTATSEKGEQEQTQEKTEQTAEKHQEEETAQQHAGITSGNTSSEENLTEDQDQETPAAADNEPEQKADEMPEPVVEKPAKGPVEEKSDDPVVAQEPVKKHPAGAEDQKEVSEEKQTEEETAEAKAAEQKEDQEKTTDEKSSTASSDEREFYDFGEDSEAEDDEEQESTEPEAAEKQEDEHPDFDTFSREQLVEELEKLVAKDDLLNFKTEIALIKVAYLKKTDMEKASELEKQAEDSAKKQEQEPKEEQDEKEEKKPQKDELAERFNAAFELYKEKRKEYREQQELLQQENLEKKKAILEELRELINSEETLKKTYDDFKALQEKWKDIGMVPKAEVNELWKNYHFLVEKFFDKVKINKELRDLDLKKNLELKIELCEKAEELILEKSINKSFKELQALHEKYRQTGPVPADVKEEVWNRFKSATEKLHDRRRKHYQELEEQQQKNLDAKTALCEKMENLIKNEYSSVKEWNQASDHVKEMMNLWRSIGFVPKQYNESIWNRFKTSVDSFYDNKKDFFKELKDEQRDNYNRKLNLCNEAEALQDSTDWKNTTRELINLQKEWKKVGPVSRKHSDKLWKRFRTANDKFFNSKDEYFKNRKDKEKENLQKKQELIDKIKTYEFGEDKNDNLKMLKDIQREWMSIGFVPFDRKDKIQKEYQDIINKRMDELSISNAEVNSSQYKSHVDNLKDMPGGERQLRKERGGLLSKVNKLREDVKLWENNTGFLANTKNADVLKKEFQNKIDKAKREIALLEAQIKILDE